MKSHRSLVVINTQKGLFKYTRLPFGISLHRESFEGHGGGVIAYSDDILVSTAMKEEHLQKLEVVFEGLEISRIAGS